MTLGTLLKRAAAVSLVMLVVVPYGAAQPPRPAAQMLLAQADPVAEAVQSAAERAAERSMRRDARSGGGGREAAGQGADRRILTADGLGPLGAGAVYDQAFGWVGRRFPPEKTTVDVGGATLPALAFTNKNGRVVVEAVFASEDGPLQWIRILGGKFQNAEGHAIRQPFAEIYPDGADAGCGPGEGWLAGTVVCWEADEAALGLVFARPRKPFPAGTMPPSRALDRLRVRQLVWRAEASPAAGRRAAANGSNGSMDGGSALMSSDSAGAPRPRRQAHGAGAEPASATAATATRAAESAGDPSLAAVRTTELLRTSTDVLGDPLVLPRESIVSLEVTSGLVELDAGASTAWHEHVVPMFVHMLEGEIEVSYRTAGGIETRVYRAGDTFMEAEGVPHRGHVPAGGAPVRLLQVFLGAPDIEPTVALEN